MKQYIQYKLVHWDWLWVSQTGETSSIPRWKWVDWLLDVTKT